MPVTCVRQPALVRRMVAVASTCSATVSMPASARCRPALDSLEGVDGTDRERARLHSAMAAADLVDDRLDEAITHGDAAARRASEATVTRLLSMPPSTLGSALVFRLLACHEGWLAARRGDSPRL